MCKAAAPDDLYRDDGLWLVDQAAGTLSCVAADGTRPLPHIISITLLAPPHCALICSSCPALLRVSAGLCVTAAADTLRNVSMQSCGSSSPIVQHGQRWNLEALDPVALNLILFKTKQKTHRSTTAGELRVS